MPPEQKGVAVGHVGCGDFNAERISEAGIFVPVTDVGRRYPVGTAKTVEKPRQPALRVGDGCSAAGAFGQSNGARTVALPNSIQSPRDIIQRLVPSDPLPSRIGVALGACPLQRKIEPIGMIHQLRRCFALDTENTAVGMIMVCIETDDFSIRDGCDGRAVGGAESAIAAHSMGVFDRISHPVLTIL